MRLPLAKIALVLVRLDHLASRIVNANRSTVSAANVCGANCIADSQAKGSASRKMMNFASDLSSVLGQPCPH